MPSAPRHRILGPVPGLGEDPPALAVASGPAGAEAVLLWTIPRNASDDPDALARLVREIEAAQRLLHPAILRVRGLAGEEGSVTLETDAADAERLARILERGRRLPPAIAARIVADACAAVEHAHETGDLDGLPMVHGHIGPSALLIASDGRALLTGFVNPDVGGPRGGRRAPEQVLAGRRAETRETDVYLLGLLLHECLSGEPPFATEGDLDAAVLSRPLPPLAAGIPAELAAVVERATAKKLDARPPTAAALGEQLARALPHATHEEVAAHVAALFADEAPARAERRSRIAAAIAAAPREAAASAGVEEPADDLVVGDATPPPDRTPQPLPVEEELADELIVGEGTPAPFARPAAVAPAVGDSSPSATPTGSVHPERPVHPERSVLSGAASAAEAKGAKSKDAGAESKGPPAAPSSSSAGRGIALFLAGAAVALAGVGIGYVLSTPRWSEMMAARGAPPHPDPLEHGGAQRPAPPSPPLAPVQPPPAGPALASSPAGAASPSPIAAPIAAAPATPTPVAPPHPDPLPGGEGKSSAAPATVAAPVRPSPSPEPIAKGPPSIEVLASPAADVWVDGKRAGRPPLVRAVAKGKHTVRLLDRSRGIDVRRTVEVRGARTRVQFTVGKGRVSVSAPGGAKIFIDGRLAGTGDLKDFPVYEGDHQLTVTLGSARHDEPFSLGSGESWEYEVTKTVKP